MSSLLKHFQDCFLAISGWRIIPGNEEGKIAWSAWRQCASSHHPPGKIIIEIRKAPPKNCPKKL